MKFRFQQVVPVPHHRVVEFFSDVSNLRRISPPYPALSIAATSTAVVPGAEFCLLLNFGVFNVSWKSVIASVIPERSFTDTCSGSMFRVWKHMHQYEPIADGSLLTDEIECEPVWWLRPFAWFFVNTLFMYRRFALLQVLK